MPRLIPEQNLQAILAIVSAHPEGIGLSGIHEALTASLPTRTLQYQLKNMVESDQLVRRGERRGTRYFAPQTEEKLQAIDEHEAENVVPFSIESKEIQQAIRRPLKAREPVGYRREFLDSYIPNESTYLTDEERSRLKDIGTNVSAEQAAGTYVRQILSQLLIDLSWNSSRLEGNTYSLLDTQRLINFGQAVEGKNQMEAQMILNHKDAIEFIANSENEIGFNRITLLNLHALLANNLLDNPDAAGRLRNIGVGIGKSAFHPLEVPQVIEECFDLILEKADEITDPFEQSFFVMVQLPYLQPFDDVNKRVSRLAANISLIKANLAPLSFTDVPTKLYKEATLAVYELNRVELLKEIYLWAYERSAQRYKANRQSLGQPDPFRLKYRDAMKTLIQEIVSSCLAKKQALTHIETWSNANISKEDQQQFQEVLEDELTGLHEGNFSRFQIRPAEFKKWELV